MSVHRLPGTVFTEDDALRFIESAGFCLLFPYRPLPVASLWQAVKGPVGFEAWDEDADRLWGWKDLFPLRGQAFYGKLLKRRPTFIGRRSLPLFLAAAGRSPEPRDYEAAYEDGLLSTEALRIARHLEEHGRTSTATLRIRLGGRRKSSIDTGLAVLQSMLFVTHYGVEQRGGAWPSGVVELVTRAFPEALSEAAEHDPGDAREEVAALFRRQVPEATPATVRAAFGWSG